MVTGLAGDGDALTVVKLSPEHLGDLEVGVSLRDGEANVAFASGVAETRAALEQALPKLRELMGQAGLELANASVHSSLAGGSDRRQESLTEAPGTTSRLNDDTATDEEPVATGREAATGRDGGVDLYA